MELYSALLSAAFNILSLYIDVRLLKLFLPVKITKFSVTMPIYISIWLINWTVYYFFNIPDLTTISLLIGLVVAAIVIFDGSIFKKILAVVISNATGIISENIVWKLSAVSFIPIRNPAVGELCSFILKFLIVLCIEHFTSPDRYARLSKGGYFNILLVSIGSVVLSEVITLQNVSGNSAMACLSVICLMNVGTYYIYEKLSESWKDRLKNTEMEQQIKMYTNQFDIISQAQQNISSLRHDMKNHISLLNIFLSNKEYEKASEYIQTLSEGFETKREYIKTGNIEFDSILNYKLEFAKNKYGCITDIQIDVPIQSIMPGFDLNILLGNLLDNAMEAAGKTEQKFVNIRIKYEKRLLYISIHNSFDGHLMEKNGKLLSIKKDTRYHGIGLDNVKNIIDKYEGTMKIDHDNSIFKIDIILFPKTV